MSVCYVTHVNSYLLEDLDGETTTRTAWEANARLMGLDDDDCDEVQADAVFSDVDDVDETRNGPPRGGVRDSIAAAGRRLSHSIGGVKQHMKTDSAGSALSSTSSTSSGGTRRVRFARRHLSIGFQYSMPDDASGDDDEESVDSSDATEILSRFYNDDETEDNPAFLTCIESDSEDDASEYETDSDSESRVDVSDLADAAADVEEGEESDDGFSDDDDAGNWSDVESDSEAEEEAEPVPEVGRSRSIVDRGAIMAMFGPQDDQGGKESSSQSSSRSSLLGMNSDAPLNSVRMPESSVGMVGASEQDLAARVKGRNVGQVVTKKDFENSGVNGQGKKKRGSLANAFARTFAFPRRRSSSRKGSRTAVTTA
jgi:hypothetical protein